MEMNWRAMLKHIVCGRHFCWKQNTLFKIGLLKKMRYLKIFISKKKATAKKIQTNERSIWWEGGGEWDDFIWNNKSNWIIVYNNFFFIILYLFGADESFVSRCKLSTTLSTTTSIHLHTSVHEHTCWPLHTRPYQINQYFHFSLF